MYNLHNLGWHSFQQLCLAIAREVLGQTVETYLDSNDGGRDGAFTGNWKAAANEDLSGTFVIQCKFSAKHNRPLRIASLKDEVEKAARLVDGGRCDNYLLMTNAGVSGRQSEKIEALFEDVGVKRVKVFGEQWIIQQIIENKQLRKLVPRVYGLGDLGQILDERAYAQARAVLDSMREDLAKVVITEAYHRAVKAIDQDNFVLLIGEPAAGKTTIASLLAMAAVDSWGASLLKLDDPSSVGERWNPEEPSQFFWIDDAFGVTQYEEGLVRGWNHSFPQIKTMLRRGAKVVMTSRDYIYRRARNDLKSSAFPLMRERQVVIDVHELTEEERRQILYNHLKLGNQPKKFLTAVKPFLDEVAAHPRFVPETARRLGDPLFTKEVRPTSYDLMDFVGRREKFLEEVLTGLDQHSRAALALIYMRKDHLQSPIEIEGTEEQALKRLGSDLGRSIQALEALDGSLVISSRTDGEIVWRFKHPTIGDAYAASLTHSPELLGIFVHGSATENLIEQVTCGDVGREKAVVIPKVLFPAVLDRLDEFSETPRYKTKHLASYGAERAIQRFLTWRCSKEFLSAYLVRHPDLLEQVAEPGLYLDTVSEVDLAVRLYEFGLLPEPMRQKFVETIRDYALTGQDMYGLRDTGIRKVFTEMEFRTLLSDVRLNILPKLDDLRTKVQSESSSESRDSDIQNLIDSFEALKTHFGSDAGLSERIDKEIERANEWLHDQSDEPFERAPRAIGDVDTGSPISASRSIFDDVDV